MTAGMLSGKEVTEKADGIVPKAPARAAGRLSPPDYRQVCLSRRPSRGLVCRET